MVFGVYICFLNHGENDYTGLKVFTIIEALQFLAIALKLNNLIDFHWNYVLVYFMLASIYMIVLGSILSVIMFCSIIGYLYQGLESWKIKSLIWMTIYYIGYGYSYVEIIKVFNESGSALTKANRANFTLGESNQYVFKIAACGLILTSLVLTVLHLTWKASIRKYFARVMFKDDLRKEISLKKISKDFPLKFIQLSSSFFKRDTELSQEEKRTEENMADADGEEPVGVENVVVQDAQPKSDAGGNDNCIICYTNEPNIIIEPCGHGGMCQGCMLNLIQKERICPFCRKNMDHIYIVKTSKGSNIVK